MSEKDRAERVADAVRTVPMFRGLPPDAQKHIAGLASLRDYRRGEHLWHEGDAPEWFTIVLRGRVKVVKEGESADVIYELFGEGEPVGAIAVYNFMPYPAAAVALEPTTLLVLPRRDWFELLDRNPEFARAIIRELTRLVLALTRKLDDMRGHTVESRIALSTVVPTRSATSCRVSWIGTSVPSFVSRPIRSARVRNSCAMRVSTVWPRISSSLRVRASTSRVSSRMIARANSGLRSSNSNQSRRGRTSSVVGSSATAAAG